MSPKRKYEIMQSQLGTTYGLTIDEDGVFYYSKDFNKSFETFFTFSEIAEKKKIRYESGSRTNALWQLALYLLSTLCMILCAFGVQGLTNFLLSLLFGLIALVWQLGFTVKNVCIPITQGDDISFLFFFENKPNYKSGDRIVDAIYKARAANYREKYFRIIDSNPKEIELGRMEWLLSEQIISKPEYTMMVDLIEDSFNFEEE